MLESRHPVESPSRARALSSPLARSVLIKKWPILPAIATPWALH